MKSLTDKGKIMAYEVKINTGSLFSNDNKEKDIHPDWKGKLKIDPSIIDKDGFVEIAGWDKVSQNGLNFKSLSVQKPYVKPEERTQNDDPITDDEIPF